LNRSYPAKLLLFGEYTILNQGVGLSVPMEQYCGEWKFEKSKTDSNEVLRSMSNYLIELNIPGFNKQEWLDDVEQGLFFHSNIPQGYGLGSSGALTAAIFDTYISNKPTELISIQNILIEIEGFFHGKSSGLDPLVAYLNQGVLSNEFGLQPTVVPNINAHFFLVDTHHTRQSSVLVKDFLEKYKEQHDFKLQMDRLAEWNHQAISAF